MSASTTGETETLIDLENNESRITPHDKPTVIGLYGVPGCGKTYLMNQLKKGLGEDRFSFHEGSSVISDLVPGGLDAFRALDTEQKDDWRKRAIDSIKDEATTSGKVAIVTGHFMFWSEKKEQTRVCTSNDLATYTHILYLDVNPDIVLQRRRDDKERNRDAEPLEHLQMWQDVEKAELRELCLNSGILFMPLASYLVNAVFVKNFILDFERHGEIYNSHQAKDELDKILINGNDSIESMLVLDADRTLTDEDTGKLFWEKGDPSAQALTLDGSALTNIFKSSMQHSYLAFRQMTLLYEESSNDVFNLRCRDVASKTKLYPEFISLLRVVKEQHHVGAVILTCGLRRIWEEILEREGLSEHVKVIGGGRISDGFVVTPTVKGELVARLQERHKIYVSAFGDSPLDLPMLKKANQAIVVVGNESKRSKTMDATLAKAIDHEGFHARQAILPSSAPPRLDDRRLPEVKLTQREFIADVLARGIPERGIVTMDATDRMAAKLLMTPMRDASMSGPALREAHRRTGMYLATELVSSLIGVERYPVKHVQGSDTDGFRLLHEKETLIISLMRGGDPMALGVSDAFPLAMYLHAKSPEDIKTEHLEGHVSLLLVDSVVNSGKSIADFVRHIRNLHATIRIVVVAGVVQANSISGGPLSQALTGSYDTLNIVALRLSKNKYSGKGGTDTGNRLFNTKHLP
jgi:uracil phosphoribosyltransferase/phosphoserine phosphatase/adenylate kinase